jgi:penicillin-binding protein 2
MKTYFESVDSEWFNQRIAGTMLVVLLAFAILMIRLLYLQVVEGKEYRRLSEINSIRLHDIDAPRGLVFDRHHHMLVDNRPSIQPAHRPEGRQTLGCHPGQAQRADRGNGGGAGAAHQKEQKARGLHAHPAKRGYRPRPAGHHRGAQIRPARCRRERLSPPALPLDKTTSAHLLGYVGEISAGELAKQAYAGLKGGDYIGKFGIEKAYEEVLRGVRGGRQVEVNATGQVVSVLNTVPAVAGRNIVLTIDRASAADGRAAL